MYAWASQRQLLNPYASASRRLIFILCVGQVDDKNNYSFFLINTIERVVGRFSPHPFASPLWPTPFLEAKQWHSCSDILYKTLFATNFIGNTCKFYNFVENDYPQKNYLPIRILRKNCRKKSFLANFFNKFAKKSHIIWEFIVVAPSQISLHSHLALP